MQILRYVILIGVIPKIDIVQNMRYSSGSMSHKFTNLLREHNVQVTAQRLAVLRAVSSHPHCTAEEVAEDVRDEIGTISRQSVYDALATLTDKGLVRRIQPAGSAALYEDRVGDNHHHLVCRVCKKLHDIDCAAGSAPCLSPSTDAGYQIDEAEVVYWGTCPECLAATPEHTGG